MIVEEKKYALRVERKLNGFSKLKTRNGSDRTFWENNTCLELNYKINNKKAKSIVWTW